MPSSGDMQATYTANELNQYTQRTVPGFVDVMGVASTSAVVTVRDAAHAELPAPVVRQNDYFYTAYSVSNTASAFTNSLEINAVINPLGTNDPDLTGHPKCTTCGHFKMYHPRGSLLAVNNSAVK